VAPEPEQWLQLDEAERMLLVERFHERARISLPQARLHAVIHTVVENQLAEAIPQVVAAMRRLVREGLDRHDAIHAVGSVLAKHLFDALSEGSATRDVGAAYYADLETLTAEGWRAS
jgi:hypothetical protein